MLPFENQSASQISREKMLSINYQHGQHVLYYQAENLKDEFDELDGKFKALHTEYKEKARSLEFLKRDMNKMKAEKYQMQAYVLQKRAVLKEYGFSVPASSGCDLIKRSSLTNDTHDLTFINNFTCRPATPLLSSSSPTPTTTTITTNDDDHLSSVGNGISDSNTSTLHRLENVVIALLQSLPGTNLNEKIRLLMQSVAQHRQQLQQLKEQLIQGQDRNRCTQKKIEDKLQIKLNRGQLQKVDSGSMFGENKLFELRFQLKQIYTQHQMLTAKLVRMERRIQTNRTEEIDTDQRLDRLRIEKKKLQRELRDAQARIIELETDCGRNQKLVERLKENRLIEIRAQTCHSDEEDASELIGESANHQNYV